VDGKHRQGRTRACDSLNILSTTNQAKHKGNLKLRRVEKWVFQLKDRGQENHKI
jgi:hypothetical protein